MSRNIYRARILFNVSDTFGNRKRLHVDLYYNTFEGALTGYDQQILRVFEKVNAVCCRYVENEAIGAPFHIARTRLNISGIEITLIVPERYCHAFENNYFPDLENFKDTVLPAGFNLNEIRKHKSTWEINKNGAKSTMILSVPYPTFDWERRDIIVNESDFIFPLMDYDTLSDTYPSNEDGFHIVKGIKSVYKAK